MNILNTVGKFAKVVLVKTRKWVQSILPRTDKQAKALSIAEELGIESAFALQWPTIVIALENVPQLECRKVESFPNYQDASGKWVTQEKTICASWKQPDGTECFEYRTNV